MENNTFKTVAFGGFAKEDVVCYIENYTKESAQIQLQLRQQIKDMDIQHTTTRAALVAVEHSNQELEIENQDLQARCSKLEKELEEAKVQCTQLDQSQGTMDDLQTEVKLLRPDAQAYQRFREGLGTIECEARERAAFLEKESFNRLSQVLENLRSQQQTLTTSFESSGAFVLAELRKIEVNLIQVPRALDQVGIELDELYQKVKDAEQVKPI